MHTNDLKWALVKQKGSSNIAIIFLMMKDCRDHQLTMLTAPAAENH